MTNFYVTLRGQIDPGAIGEMFLHGMAVQSSLDSGSVASGIRAAWQNTWGSGATGIGQHFPAKVQYDEVTVAQILKITGGTPPVISTATHAPFTPALTGRHASNSIPPSQSAIAVSLSGGAKPNGAPHKGRFYLPPPSSQTLDASGLLTNAVRDSLALDIAGAFVEQLNATGIVVCIWSKKWGEMDYVETLRIGNRVDTIRSRRNANVEQYKIEPITGPA